MSAVAVGAAVPSFGSKAYALACWVLLVVFGQVLGSAAGCAMAGCADTLKHIDDINNPQDDRDMKRCRDLGRAVRDAGEAPEDAYQAYVDCTVDAGLRSSK